MKHLKLLIAFISVALLYSCSSNQEVSEEATGEAVEEALTGEVIGESYVTYSNMDSIKMEFEDAGFIDPSDFDEFKSKYQTEVINGITYYVVEGDLFYNEEQLFEYFLALNFTGSSQKLVGEIRDGKIVRTPDPKNISYSIIKSSFDNDMEYQNVVDFMTEATNDWAGVCNIEFKYYSTLDSELNINDNPDSLTFVVKKHIFNGGTIARAFFPYYPKIARKILVGQSFFTSSFSKPGVLRHELGHVLGFRHEHIRSGAPSTCPGENTAGTIDITDYDPQSVMHYFCGGVGSKELLITDIDSIGASQVYPF